MRSLAHSGYPIEHEDEDFARINEKSNFGFWIFLMSDAILFAILFATYAVLLRGTGAGPSPGAVIALHHVFPETIVLLLSTLTLGFASIAMRHGETGKLLQWLSITLILGTAFLALEAHEFSGMLGRGETPQTSGFLSAFFTLVGTHGLHVGAGVLWGVVMIVQILTLGLSDPIRSRLVRLALYWHLLDIVWVAIFSVVYLPGALG